MGEPWLQDPDVTACIPWWGYIAPDGYGRINRRRWPAGQLAHRYVYEEAFGPLPRGWELHHECRQPACVNPEHLTPVNGTAAHRKLEAQQRTHCRRGHDYTAHGRWHTDGSGRYCRRCERDNERRRSRAAMA